MPIRRARVCDLHREYEISAYGGSAPFVRPMADVHPFSRADREYSRLALRPHSSAFSRR
jgi:hypothetical protein